MREIKKMLTKYNHNKGGNRKEFIIIHDVGTVSTALNNARYFAGGNRNASAHYFVDNTDTIQIVEDSDRAWHAGTSAAKSRNGVGNENSIGIEICLAGDLEVSIAHTVELTAYLMKKHNIPLSKVVRHFDATGKICPRSMSANNWMRWHKFRVDVEKALLSTEPLPTDPTGVITVTTDMLNVRSGAGANFTRLGSIYKTHKREVFGKVGAWYKIVFDDSVGYIHSGYVNFEEIKEDVVEEEKVKAEKIDDDKVKLEVRGFIMSIDGFKKDNKNYVSVREILEHLGYSVSWDNEKQTVVAK